MTDSLNVQLIDIKSKKLDVARIFIAQPSLTNISWEKINGLSFPIDPSCLSDKIYTYLSKAETFKPHAVIFPELSVPETTIKYIAKWSLENNVIVIAGSHYYKKNGTFFSRSPIIINGHVYYTEKISPAPEELSASFNNGLTCGTTMVHFQNTAIGNFGVLICSDYLNKRVKDKILSDETDILFVTAFQRVSEVYYDRMKIDCDDAKSGLYLVYANVLCDEHGDGRSSVFGIMDKKFAETIESKFSDLNPPCKALEIKQGDSFGVVDLNIKHKKPFIKRNALTKPNINIVHIDDSDTEGLLRENISANGKEPYKSVYCSVLTNTFDIAQANISLGNEFIINGRAWLLSTSIHWGPKYYDTELKIANTIEGILSLILTFAPITPIEQAVINEATKYLLSQISEGGLKSLSMKINTVHCTALGLYVLEYLRIHNLYKFKRSDIDKVNSLKCKLTEKSTDLGWGFAIDATPSEGEIRIPFTLWALRAINIYNNKSKYDAIIMNILSNLLIRMKGGELGFNIHDNQKASSVALLLILISEIKNNTMSESLLKQIKLNKLLSYLISHISRGNYIEIEEYDIKACKISGVEKLSWTHISIGYSLQALSIYKKYINSEETEKLHVSVNDILHNSIHTEGYFIIDGIKKINPLIYPTVYLINGIYEYINNFKGVTDYEQN
ncbi:hypothetical protein [Geobacter sp. AOG2]|uniref:hypothetical protein n=1 Tax=Geobacter sp. AOG2 TaxID=1566347 RepID=UPI001CC5D60E|nr:hypothetical protein [Geobacter sp. AOG2]GFE59540.1 hypothetical protein AOG2_01280 [Geobacter sp. AOG2]